MHNDKPTDPEEILKKQLRELAEKAASGDPQDVQKLRAFLRDHSEVWQEAGDLANLAAKRLILAVAEKDILLRESLFLQLESFKTKLAEPPGHPLETILIDQIAICWLQANAAAIILTDNSNASKEQWEFLQQRSERGQKNLVAAVKELCTVRKLLCEAKARPIRQPRASTKAAASQTQPATADPSPTCDAGSPTNASASNFLPRTTQGQGTCSL